jgi:hypothetical protein
MTIQSSTSPRASWVHRAERLYRSRTVLLLAVLTCLLAAGCDSNPVAPDAELSDNHQVLATVSLRVDAATGAVSTIAVAEPGTRGISAADNIGGHLRQERATCAECRNLTPGYHKIFVTLRHNSPGVELSAVTIHGAYCYQHEANCELTRSPYIQQQAQLPDPMFYGYPFDVVLEVDVPKEGDFEVWFQVKGGVMP